MKGSRLLVGVALCLVGFDLPTPGLMDALRTPDPVLTPIMPGSLFTARATSLALPVPSPSAGAIRDAMAAGDTDRALRVARRYVEEHRWGRTRDAAWLVIGLLERERGHANDASAAFTKVRAAEGPLAEFGAFYEAEQDLERGKPFVAIRECERLLETWPKSTHEAACRRIVAMGWATTGNDSRALSVAEEYDEDHPIGPITEQVRLKLAEGYLQSNPDRAADALRDLAVDHTAPLTGRISELLLAQLAERGIQNTELPTDTESLKLRARSLRDAGRTDDTWAIWDELAIRAEDNRRLGQWLDANITSFAWRLRNWERLTGEYESRYNDDADGDLAWRLHRAHSRAGDFEAATAWVAIGRENHGGRGSWRNSEDVQAQAYLLGGLYEQATELLDVAAARRGWTARRATFRGAFSTYMAGDHADAIARFTSIIDAGRSDVSGATYWRARAYDALDEHDSADTDRAWLAQWDSQGWYGQLAKPMTADTPTEHPFARDGRWPGAALPLFEPAASPLVSASEPAVPRQLARNPTRAANPGFSGIRWRVLPPPPRVAAEQPSPELLPDLTRPPASYRPAPFHILDDSREFTSTFAERHGDSFPMLRAAVDMAEVGLYDLSGPLMAATYEDITKARRQRGHRNHTAARRIPPEHADWRKVFLHVHDHHHSARFTFGMHEAFETAEEQQQARRLTYPLAYDRFVWDRAEENSIDPYLVLSLMRQESVYDPNALSRVGARGAMQIMPNTGHRIADLTLNVDYTAADLEDPIASIGYGVTYLARLMKRFDNAYPLAIASYNGGPHNVSAWLKGTTADMPMDAFVEHIPFKETRGYVQSVSSHYATYLSLYAPEGTELAIPPHPSGDHPEVVDF
ncbi:MAG: hypothetical protein ACJATT_004566 [Myxococcota bacterium]|jgi:hypothetical protein